MTHDEIVRAYEIYKDLVEFKIGDDSPLFYVMILDKWNILCYSIIAKLNQISYNTLGIICGHRCSLFHLNLAVYGRSLYIYGAVW